MIVDEDNKVPLAPYLLIRLKNNDKYFTQTQVLIYVIGATMCHFYICSQCNKVYLKINGGIFGCVDTKNRMVFF